MLRRLIDPRQALARFGDKLPERGSLHSPYSGCVPRRAGDQSLAIGAERHRMDIGLMAAQGPDLLPRRGIPQPDRLVSGRGGDRLAVVADLSARDTILVAAKHKDYFTRRYVPKPGGLVLG